MLWLVVGSGCAIMEGYLQSDDPGPDLGAALSFKPVDYKRSGCDYTQLDNYS